MKIKCECCKEATARWTLARKDRLWPYRRIKVYLCDYCAGPIGKLLEKK